MASWYLDKVIVHDLLNRDKYYFLCQQWIALEKGDGKIERVLFVACDAQKSHLKYQLETNVKHKLSDSHLWWSILARPVQSSFTRLERVTSCFVVLFLTMLMNIMYYSSRVANSNQFNLTVEQVVFFLNCILNIIFQ